MKIFCSVCEETLHLSLSEFTYINWDEPFVCSSECLLKWIKQHKNKKPRHKYKHRKIDGGIFKSNYEIGVAKFLQNNKISFEYETVGFFLNDCSYTPDFFIPLYDCFLEVKGLWHTGTKKKLKQFRKLYPETSLLVVPWVINTDFLYKGEIIK